MSNIHKNLMYLQMRLPNLESVLKDADEEFADALSDRIDSCISSLLSEGAGVALEGGQLEALQSHWEAIKKSIKPQAHIDTHELIEDIEKIRASLMPSISAQQASPTSYVADEIFPEEEVAQLERSSRYAHIQQHRPKLIPAFKHILTQAHNGIYGERIRQLLIESAPELTELRPLLRMMLVEIVEDPERAPEFVGDLKKLDRLKDLLPDSPRERAELRESIILGELPKAYEVLEKELNHLTALYSAQNQGELDKDFKDIIQVLFGEVLSGNEFSINSSLGSLAFRLETVPENIRPDQVNSWLQSIPEPHLVSHINLRSSDIEIWPSALSRFTRLIELDLSDNPIQNIPSNIAEFSDLKVLDFSRTNIQTLPLEIGQLVKLESFSAQQTKLQALPREIWDLEKLNYLDLGKNKLQSISQDISNLRSLQVLNLSYNQIAEFPQEMQELKHLHTLHVQGNSIRGRPPVLDHMPWITSVEWRI